MSEKLEWEIVEDDTLIISNDERHFASIRKYRPQNKVGIYLQLTMQHKETGSVFQLEWREEEFYSMFKAIYNMARALQ